MGFGKPCLISTSTIGNEFDVSGKYIFRHYLVLNAGVGHLFPGALLTANHLGAAETLACLSLTYRFRVDRKAHQTGASE